LHQGIAVNFRVYGTPRPGGSKKAFVIPGINRACVTEDCKKSKDWRADVRHACQQAYTGPLLTGPLFLRIIFWIARPKGHYGSGKNAVVRKNRPFGETGKIAMTFSDSWTNMKEVSFQ